MLSIEAKKSNSFSKKNLVIVESKIQFQKIIEEIEQLSPSTYPTNDEQRDNQFQNKEQIYVPRHGSVSQSQLIRQKPKHLKSILTQGYFRLRRYHNLPNPQKYDLNIEDMQFIRTLKHSYDFKKKYKLRTRTFIDIIESCQHNFHKKKSINLHDDSSVIIDQLSFSLESNIAYTFNTKQRQMMRKLICQIIDYWKKYKIERRTFPLLRCYWPKTDIAMSKYNVWVPYRTRVLEQSSKKQHSSSLIRNFGNTQRQKNISKQAKDATCFYQQVKELADTQYSQHQRFSQQVSKFHEYAALYNFKSPSYLSDVVEGKQNKDYFKLLGKSEKSPYFRNPLVKLSLKSRFIYKPVFQRSFEVKFNPQIKLLQLKQGSQILPDQSAYHLQRKRSYSNENQRSPKIQKKSRDLRIYRLGQKHNKGSKKVKLQKNQ